MRQLVAGDLCNFLSKELFNCRETFASDLF